MIIRRSAKKWTATPIAAAEDKALSLEARGLLWYLLVKPDSWEVRTEDLLRAGRIGPEPEPDKAKRTRADRLLGPKALRRLIDELERAGYMRRTMTNTSAGAKWTIEVHDIPLPASDRKIHKARTKRKSPSGHEGNLAKNSPSGLSPSSHEGHLGLYRHNNHDNYITNNIFLDEAPADSGQIEPTSNKKNRSVKAIFQLPDLSAAPEIVDAGRQWLDRFCPLVSASMATVEFLKHHQSEATLFKTQPEFLKAWRGWMRNAQKFAENRRDNRGKHGQTSNTNTQSSNVRNLQSTIEQHGTPEPSGPVDVAQQIRLAGAARAHRARTASEKRG